VVLRIVARAERGEGTGSAGREPEGVDRTRDVVLGHGRGLAGVDGFEGFEQLAVVLDDARDAQQDRGPVLGGLRCPVCLGRHGRRDGGVDVLNRTGGDLHDGFLGGRIHHIGG
jgi:hypothetical protein